MYVLRLSRHRHLCDFRVPLIPYHHPLICGDFQAMRNKEDVEDMACPTKYMMFDQCVSVRFQTFEADTVVNGRNHEASNYMWEL